MTEPTGAVFVSYASQDAEAAGRIAAALRAAGVEVWLDQRELRGGEAWDRKIRKEIHDCALFIPVISANAHARDEGYFRLEWKLAADRSNLMAPDKTFVLPVVIDHTPQTDERIPDRFRELQWSRLPDGRVPPAFIERVSRLLAHHQNSAAPVHAPATVAINATVASRQAAGTSVVSRWSLLVVALIAAGLVSYIAIEKLWLSKRGSAVEASAGTASSGAPSRIPEKSIAVLPFVDMSEKHDQEYFTDGLTEELIDKLANAEGLRVTARTSSFAFKGKNDDMRTIASKLGVAHLLEGSVRKSGVMLRITAQLIRADDGTHLWSHTYDRHLVDVFRVQDEIAGTVSAALKSALGSSSHAINALEALPGEVHDLLMRGNFYYERSNTDDAARALEEYEKAAKLAPESAVVWERVGIASALAADYIDSIDERQLLYQKSEQALKRSLDLDPNYGLAHRSLAGLRDRYHWDPELIERELLQAQTLGLPHNREYVNPLDLADIRSKRSGTLDPGAVKLAKRAIQVNPLDWLGYNWLSGFYETLGQYEQAIGAQRELILIAPGLPGGHSGLADLLVRTSRLEEAARVTEQEPDPFSRAYAQIEIAWAAGRRQAAAALLREFEAKYGQAHPEAVAALYAQQGDHTHALDVLERALMVDPAFVQDIRIDPDLRLLKDEPRYHSLLKAMKLDN